MPTLYYAIEDGNHTPKRYVKSIVKTPPTSYVYTTNVNMVQEYTVQATAQADAEFCNIQFGERFHVVASPKPH